VLDHRDSFVFTLVDHFARLGATVSTLRTSITLAQLQHALEEFDPDLILLSPGPGRPEGAGVMVPFLQTGSTVPIVGVCLGHQAMAVAAGGSVVMAPVPVHGRASSIVHFGDDLFAGIPRRFRAARYHSLVVEGVPPEFEALARSDEDPSLVMAMRHVSLPRIGLQFHPESVLTPFGARLIANLLHDSTTVQRSQRSVP
jgi:anthranilate synthase/aminodeoxychorismate synthase-like glutamine amidotransferase